MTIGLFASSPPALRTSPPATWKGRRGGGQVCKICSDGMGTTAEGDVFAACDVCSFPVSCRCYEYEHKDSTQACPQCKIKYKCHKEEDTTSKTNQTAAEQIALPEAVMYDSVIEKLEMRPTDSKHSTIGVGEELLPLASDADEGCQWEVQTDEGWTPYWDPQA